MNKVKSLLQGIGIFAGTLLLLWGFLIVAAAIPNHALQKNMEKSALYYTKSEAFAFCDKERMNGIADNYADSIWVNVAWYMGKGNPMVSSIDTIYYDGEGRGQNVGLYEAVTDEEQEGNTDYTRYWHGTAGVIRILHLFTDVNGIKYLGLITALSLAAVIMILLIRDRKDRLAFAFAVSICAVKIWNIRLSMEYQPAFILSFLLCILYLMLEKKGNKYLNFLPVISGTATAFFDFLTTETMVILLPLILVIAIRALDKRVGTLKDNLMFVILQGMTWLVSYGTTILIKWLLATVLTGENKFALALFMAKERVNGTVYMHGNESMFLQRWNALAANLTVLFGGTERIEDIPLTAGIILLVIFGIIFGICMFKTRKESKTAKITLKTKQEKRIVTVILFLLGLIVVLRYLVLSNHSYLHAFFTYRGFVSLIMAMLSIVIVNFDKRAKGEK